MWLDHLPASVAFCDVEATGLGNYDRIVSFGGIGMISRELVKEGKHGCLLGDRLRLGLALLAEVTFWRRLPVDACGLALSFVFDIPISLVTTGAATRGLKS